MTFCCIFQAAPQRVIREAPTRLRLWYVLRRARLQNLRKCERLYGSIRSVSQACYAVVLCQLYPIISPTVKYNGRLGMPTGNLFNSKIQITPRADFNLPPQTVAYNRRTFKLPRNRTDLLQFLQTGFIRRPDFFLIQHHKRIAHTKKVRRAQFSRQHDQRSDRESVLFHFFPSSTFALLSA